MYIHPYCEVDDIFKIDSLYSCFKKTFDDKFCSDGEAHDFWECVVCLEGRIQITADEHIFVINPGQIVFHKPMQFHRIAADKNSAFTALIFSFGAHGEKMSFFEDKCFVLTGRQMEHIDYLYKESFNVFNKHLLRAKPYDPQSPYIMKSEIEILLFLIMRESKRVYSPKNTSTALLYKNIILYMKNNVEQILDVKTIAMDNAVSVSNLKKIFKQYSGGGIMDYFNKLKIERACELIARGKKISTVSEELGYSDPNYFSVVFKRIIGISPSEYKKQFFGGLH